MIAHLDATQGPPIYWYHTTSYVSAASTNVIGVWPPPSASETGKYIKLFYHELINEYYDATNNLLPDWLQDVVVWYAYAKCLERDGKFAQAEQYMSYFNNFASFWKSDLFPQEVDSKDMMVLPDFTRIAQ